MTDRSATIAATPTAMQMKKNSSRCHDARVSRTAMRRTNIMTPPAPRALPRSTPIVSSARERVSTTRPSRSTSLASAMAASSASCVTSTMRRAAASWIVRSRSMMWRPFARIEVAGRLVGEHDRRIVGERARERDALLFAARQLRRIVMRAAGQADLLEQRSARGRASATPAISIGTATFSYAVSDGIRWKN